MASSTAPIPRATAKALEAWLRGLTRPARAAVALAIGVHLAATLLLVAQTWLLAGIIAEAVVSGSGLVALWPQLWTLLAVFVTRAGVTAGGEAAAFEAGGRVVPGLRDRLHHHLLALGPDAMQRQRSGELATRLVDGTEALHRYYAAYLPGMALAAAVPLMILVAVLGLDWVSGLIMALTAPLIPLFMVLIGRGTETLNQQQWRTLARLGAHVFDAIEGLTTLKLFGAVRREIALIEASSERYRQSSIAVLRVAFLSSLALEFCATLGVAAVAVYVGFRLYGHALAFRPGLFALLLAPEFYRPLRAMGTHYHARMEAIGAAEGLLALLDVSASSQTSMRDALSRQPVGEVRFEEVGFVYGAEPVLHDVSFTLRRGERVAVVGPSGSGKSTLAQLLLGFITPATGRIRIDGVDLRDVARADWMMRVAWLPQRPTLFHGTVRDNVDLAREEGDDAVHQALTAADAGGFMAKLPQGLDTMLGENGGGLSGGEVQRIALARVLLKGAEVVVIDEAAAGLDADTAAHTDAGIAQLAPRCATLLIAHRLASVRDCDLILVLEAGRIVERGCHKDLLARGGAYARLLVADRQEVAA